MAGTGTGGDDGAGVAAPGGAGAGRKRLVGGSRRGQLPDATVELTQLRSLRFQISFSFTTKSSTKQEEGFSIEAVQTPESLKRLISGACMSQQAISVARGSRTFAQYDATKQWRQR